MKFVTHIFVTPILRMWLFRDLSCWNSALKFAGPSGESEVSDCSICGNPVCCNSTKLEFPSCCFLIALGGLKFFDNQQVLWLLIFFLRMFWIQPWNYYSLEDVRFQIARSVIELLPLQEYHTGCHFSHFKKQPPELYYKNTCSTKYCSIYRKTHLVESLFDKVEGLQATNTASGCFCSFHLLVLRYPHVQLSYKSRRNIKL